MADIAKGGKGTDRPDLNREINFQTRHCVLIPVPTINLVASMACLEVTAIESPALKREIADTTASMPLFPLSERQRWCLRLAQFLN